MSSLRGRRARARGYTAVELMLSIGLFAIGVTGIIAMQKLTVVSNQHAKNLAIATNIAEAWLDQLATERRGRDSTRQLGERFDPLRFVEARPGGVELVQPGRERLGVAQAVEGGSRDALIGVVERGG